MPNLNEKQFKFSFYITLLIQFAYAKGYTIQIGDVFAKTGHKIRSKHYSHLAIDINLFKDGDYITDSEGHRELGEFWESLDDECVWGGGFSNKDYNHYQYTHG